MSIKSFVAPNISCGHCVNTIERELGELPGVEHVHAESASKKVRIEWSAPATWDGIRALLEEIGYPPND